MSEPNVGGSVRRCVQTPGPWGYNDPTDPNCDLWDGRFLGPTPGTLGNNDPAEPLAGLSKREATDKAINEHLLSEQAVLDKINAYIDDALKLDAMVAETLKDKPESEHREIRRTMGLPLTGPIFGPPAKYLEIALATATGARKINSLDLLLRDAQYYLHTRSRVAASPNLVKPFAMMAGILASALWDLSKWVLPSGGVRTDKENPNSPPGGWTWGVVGSFDGMMDHAASGKPRYATQTPRKELEQMVQGMATSLQMMPAR